MSKDVESLTTVFKQGPLSHWPVEDIAVDPLMRFALAYLTMAREAKYRPAAPGDGMGHILLSIKQFNDEDRLLREAVNYTIRFVKEEDNRLFNIGCSHYPTNQAFLWTIEAARQLAGGEDGKATALRLLRLAAEQIKGERP